MTSLGLSHKLYEWQYTTASSCWKRFIGIVRRLVQDDGYDILVKDNNGDTPLHCAALGGSLCTLIDEFKCDPNTKGEYGRTPLHHAAEKGHIDIVRKLVHDYGCDIMAKDNDGNTPLHCAALGGSLSTVCTLIDEFKCDSNRKGRTPVYQAVRGRHIDTVRKVVKDYGCDVNAVDDDGHTPLYHAITYGLMIAELIMPKGHPGNLLQDYSTMEKSLHHTVSGRRPSTGWKEYSC